MTVSPMWLLEFSCDSVEATQVAELACLRLTNGPCLIRPRRDATPWIQTVPAGVYQLEAAFPDHTFQDPQDAVPVELPVYVEKLRV
jgi:hypothetical protein